MKGIVKILYIDSKQPNLNAFLACFRHKKNYSVYACKTSREALLVLNQTQMDIIISDQPMPFLTGFEFMEDIIHCDYNPVQIAVTAHRDIFRLQKALEAKEIFRYLEKPFDMETLDKIVEEACTFLAKGNA